MSGLRRRPPPACGAFIEQPRHRATAARRKTSEAGVRRFAADGTAAVDAQRRMSSISATASATAASSAATPATRLPDGGSRPARPARLSSIALAARATRPAPIASAEPRSLWANLALNSGVDVASVGRVARKDPAAAAGTAPAARPPVRGRLDTGGQMDKVERRVGATTVSIVIRSRRLRLRTPDPSSIASSPIRPPARS